MIEESAPKIKCPEGLTRIDHIFSCSLGIDIILARRVKAKAPARPIGHGNLTGKNQPIIMG
jgi:hypothetical protein